MDANTIPEKEFRYKRTQIHKMATIIGVIAIIFFTGLLLFTILAVRRFEPVLHLSLFAIIAVQALLIYFSKKLPPYVKISDGKIRVRQSLFGGWEAVTLGELEAAKIKGEMLYLVPRRDPQGELGIRLSSMQLEDAAELQNLVGRHISVEG
jgi:hypothetical protein